MNHKRIAVYKLQTSADTVVQRAEAGILPIFRQQPGFVAYEIIETGTDSLISISTWQSNEQADEATKIAAAWTQDNLGFALVLTDNYVGEVLLSSREP
ncbi:MAG TPA: hypothetical protein VFS96_04630 [Nitrolancea sp.]|nr:hypothetical protein [Nitrolancea sp.]